MIARRIVLGVPARPRVDRNRSVELRLLATVAQRDAGTRICRGQQPGNPARLRQRRCRTHARSDDRSRSQQRGRHRRDGDTRNSVGTRDHFRDPDRHAAGAGSGRAELRREPRPTRRQRDRAHQHGPRAAPEVRRAAARSRADSNAVGRHRRPAESRGRNSQRAGGDSASACGTCPCMAQEISTGRSSRRSRRVRPASSRRSMPSRA